MRSLFCRMYNLLKEVQEKVNSLNCFQFIACINTNIANKMIK